MRLTLAKPVPFCRVYKQIMSFNTFVKCNSPGSNIKVLKRVYRVAQSCEHLAHAITPPYIGTNAQYRVTLTGYGPQANPGTLRVISSQGRHSKVPTDTLAARTAS